MRRLKPGDIILDSAGFPAIEHLGAGDSVVHVFDESVFASAMEGEISIAQYARHANNHSEITLAYTAVAAKTGKVNLPEGAKIQRHEQSIGARVMSRIFGRE